MRRIIVAVACNICLAVGCIPARGGEIQGFVRVVEGLTKKRVTVPAYQFRGVTVSQPYRAAAPVDEMGRVVIYMEGGSLSPGTPTTVELKQQNRRFDPEILVVPAGSTVSFPNLDPIFHNVFSLSRVKNFDLGYYPAGQTRKVRFDKPGAIPVYCHLHPDMTAVVLVVPSAFNTRPDADGKFELTDVPAGSYQIVAWHKSAGLFHETIHVPQQGTVKVRFNVPVFDSPRGH